jgi:type II secretory pathway pseudopilin PulG
MIAQRRAGFSLVEVTLALGVIAFALVAILGIIPTGLRSSRDAIDDTLTALIAQDLSSRLRAEVSTDHLAVPWTDASGFDRFQLRWNRQLFPPTGLSYSNLANIAPTSYAGATPPSTVVAFYDSSGAFVKQTSQRPGEPVDPTKNLIRADIIVRPLYCDATQVIPFGGPAPSYDPLRTYYPEFVRPKTTSSGTIDYAYLSVHVSLGWPAQPVVDGALVSISVAAKKIFTFYLQKP